MDKVCDKCQALATTCQSAVNNENVYNTILLNQQDDHEECVKALLEAGADMNAKNSHGKTALIEAAIRGHVKRLQALITAGADVDEHYSMNKNGDETALTEAVSRGKNECVKLLIKSGASVNKVGQRYKYILNLAVEQDNMICADLLINAGADVNAPLFTPLYVAAKKSAIRCLNLLLKSGADVNATCSIYSTALMRVKDVECCRLLLIHGAQINITDNHGYNTLTFHMSHSNRVNKDLCIMLFAAGETTPGTVKKQFQCETDKYINVAEYLELPKFSLQHLCREAIRKQLLKVDPHAHLFGRIPKLALPKSLTEYLLYYMSLD